MSEPALSISDQNRTRTVEDNAKQGRRALELMRKPVSQLTDDELKFRLDWTIDPAERKQIIDDRKKKTVKLLSVGEILDFPPISYVVEPYAPVGSVVNMSAYTGTGKSVVTSALSIAAMSGIPFLGRYQVRKPGPVLYFDEETPRSFLKDRMTKMGFREDDPFYCAHFTGLKLDDDKDFELIQETISSITPVLVVFDTLIRFHSAAENDASEMSAVMQRLRRLANLGPCVLTQIHQNKGQGDMRTRSRGSSDIIGGCDLELSLAAKEHGLLELRSVKARMAPIDPVTLRIQEVDGRLEVAIAEEWNSEMSEALDELVAAAKDGMSITGLHKALTDQKIEISRSTVVRMVADKGLPYVEGPRRVKLYKAVPNA